MITEVKNKSNFVDALATAMRYAVLTKNNRIQILIRPKPKQLRKRGQRGWELFGTIDSDVDAEKMLEQIVKRALADHQHNKPRERRKPAKSAVNGRG